MISTSTIYKNIARQKRPLKHSKFYKNQMETSNIQNTLSLILSQLGVKRIGFNECLIEIISYMKQQNMHIGISVGNSYKTFYADDKLEYDSNVMKRFYYNFTNYCIQYEGILGWIEFDFDDNKINLKSHGILLGNKYNPKSWKLEGSNDNMYWDILDIQENISQLYQQSNSYCQYICYVQLNQWTSDEDYIINISEMKF